MNKRKYLFLLLIIPILVIFISRSFSLTYTQEIKSVEIQSNDYNNPGSWHIDKSAEWIGLGKARVTFDVNSVVKTSDARYKDVIFVMDVSGSMSGSKLDRAKQDAIDLTNYLLSDSHNSVALITFDSTSEIISGFTNNKVEMVNYITNLTDKGSTNYNAGLLNVDTVMENYVEDEHKDLIVLFLTDGYPNEDRPNEKATYGLLKDKYPYMTINGIQYEMGKDVIQDIVDISDNQFIADQSTLNNVLFEATIFPVEYDSFVVTDYINDENFYINSVNDVTVPYGEVSLEEENGVQKVIWNLGNNYKTGSKVTMTIDLQLKEQFYEAIGLYPTNKGETIVSKMPEENEKTKVSELTPVLKNGYNVIYDPNAPSDCNLSTIDTEPYIIYHNVTMRTDSLSCPGYIFKGWYIDTNDRFNMTMINDEVFVMPAHDVHIRGTWTKQGLVKAADGEVKVKIRGTLMKHTYDSAKTFGKSISRSDFESIITVDNVDVPNSAIDWWDASAEQNGSVLAWYTDTDNNGKYELYLGSEDGVIANPDSSYAFYYFRNANYIDLENFKTSNVTNMNYMFSGYGNNVTDLTLNLNDLDTSNVTSMSHMFSSFGSESKTINLSISNWDTSKVTDMSYMFSSLGYNAKTLDINIIGLNNSLVTNMDSIFNNIGYKATDGTLNLSNWKNLRMTSYNNMFTNSFKHATNSITLNLSNWKSPYVTDFGKMFYDLCHWEGDYNSYLDSYTHYGAKNVTINLTNFDTSNARYMNEMFKYAGYEASNFEIIGLETFDTSKVTNMSSMFSWTARSVSTTFSLDLSNWNTSKVTNMSHMFSGAGCNASDWNIVNISNLDTSKVTDMSYMFSSTASNVTPLNLDLSNWNTSNVTNMSYMFSGTAYYSKTINLNLSGWDTSKVTNMKNMFGSMGYYNTTEISLNLSSWNTSNVTTMENMFLSIGYKTKSLNLNLNNWNTSKVTNMKSMFANAGYSATTWNIEGISNWNTINVTTMESMFSKAGYTTKTWNLGNLSNWNTSKVTTMANMFSSAGYSATTWSIGDIRGWNT